MLAIQLFGSADLSIDGAPVHLPRRKSRALLFYLAGQEGAVTRERMLALFWPDLERASALQTLRTTLYNVRQATGEAVQVDSDRVALGDDVRVDVRRFEALLSQADGQPDDLEDRLEEALELYRGDFLLDFQLADAPEFEDWMVVERERYRRMAVRAMTRLAHLHSQRQDYRGAIVVIDRALALDPLQEDLQREAIRWLHLAGDRPGAIRRYDELRRLLDEELGMPPMAETRALYDAIITDRPLQQEPPAFQKFAAKPLTHQTPPEGNLPFVGRQSELEKLRSQTAARKLVLIQGEPGIGKTRLVEEYLRGAGGLQIKGVARELESSLPYQPMIEALASLPGRQGWRNLAASIRSRLPSLWLREAAYLLPELLEDEGRLSPLADAEESRLWEGVNRLLQALAEREPVRLFLDDLQWADRSTLGLLGYLVRRLEGVPIQILTTSRAALPRSSLATLIGTLIRENRLERIHLERLQENEITELSHKLSPAYTYPFAEWLLQSSEGNPYVLAEVVRDARQRGILTREGALNLNLVSTSPLVPQSVYSLIQARLESLSDPARRILDAAVATGREFEFSIVARAAALSETASVEALGELSAAGLVEPLEGLRYRFDHNLIMEVAYRETGDPRHRVLHRRVAEAMEALYNSHRLESQAGVIAMHFAEGHAYQRAAPYALQAGHRAFRLAAWSEAIGFYQQALEGAEEKDRFGIWMALGEVRYRSGPVSQAADAFREALRLAEKRAEQPAIDAAHLALARAYVVQARFDETIELARKVLVEGLPENAVRAELLWGTALSLEGADLDAAATHLGKARKLCQGRGEISDKRRPAGSLGPWVHTDEDHPARIRFELGSVAAQQGDLEHAVELYRQALELACGEEGLQDWCVLAHNNLAYHLHLLGNPDAREYALKGLELAREHGLFSQQTYLYSTLGEIALTDGDLGAAENYLHQGLELAEQLVIAERIAGLTANLGLVAQARGQDSLAIHRLSSALAKAEAIGTRHLAAQIRLWLVPLLPEAQGRAALEDVLAFSRREGRAGLLQQAEALKSQYFSG